MYEKETEKIRIDCIIRGRELTVAVTDHGRGIENVERAMEPMFTTKPEQDRSGMGFAFMEAFMDMLEVESEPEVRSLSRRRLYGGYPCPYRACAPGR